MEIFGGYPLTCGQQGAGDFSEDNTRQNIDTEICKYTADKTPTAEQGIKSGASWSAVSDVPLRHAI